MPLRKRFLWYFCSQFYCGGLLVLCIFYAFSFCIFIKIRPKKKKERRSNAVKESEDGKASGEEVISKIIPITTNPVRP